jgi:hypothetical protein
VFNGWELYKMAEYTTLEKGTGAGAEKGKVRCVVESTRRMEIMGESGARAGERGRGEIGASMDPLSYSTQVVPWTYIF